MPFLSVNLPISHSVQTVAWAREYCPSTHSTHAVDAFIEPKVPAGQAVHVDALSTEYSPDVHQPQPTALPFENVPPGHTLHPVSPELEYL